MGVCVFLRLAAQCCCVPMFFRSCRMHKLEDIMKMTLFWRLGLVILICGLTTATAQVIPVTIEFSQIRICWASTLGVTYQLQYQSAQNTWINLFAPVIANGAQTCLLDVYVPDRTYRVVVPQVPVGPDPAV